MSSLKALRNVQVQLKQADEPCGCARFHADLLSLLRCTHLYEVATNFAQFAFLVQPIQHALD